MYECGICYKTYKTEKRLFSHIEKRHSTSRKRTYISRSRNDISRNRGDISRTSYISRSRQDSRFEKQAVKYYTQIRRLEEDNRYLKSYYERNSDQQQHSRNNFELQNQLFLQQKNFEREKATSEKNLKDTFSNQLTTLQNTVTDLAEKLKNQTVEILMNNPGAWRLS